MEIIHFIKYISTFNCWVATVAHVLEAKPSNVREPIIILNSGTVCIDLHLLLVNT